MASKRIEKEKHETALSGENAAMRNKGAKIAIFKYKRNY